MAFGYRLVYQPDNPLSARELKLKWARFDKEGNKQNVLICVSHTEIHSYVLIKIAKKMTAKEAYNVT